MAEFRQSWTKRTQSQRLSEQLSKQWYLPWSEDRFKAENVQTVVSVRTILTPMTAFLIFDTNLINAFRFIHRSHSLSVQLLKTFLFANGLLTAACHALILQPSYSWATRLSLVLSWSVPWSRRYTHKQDWWCGQKVKMTNLSRKETPWSKIWNCTTKPTLTHTHRHTQTFIQSLWRSAEKYKVLYDWAKANYNANKWQAWFNVCP